MHNQSTNMSRPGNFKFNKLPTELRFEVWKAYIHAQRRLVILDDVYGRIRPSRDLVSILLSVNSESRVVAQSTYRMHLPVIRENLEDYQFENKGPCRGVVYINPETDIFVSGTPCFLLLKSTGDKQLAKAQAKYMTGCTSQKPDNGILFTPYHYFAPVMFTEVSESIKTMLMIYVRDNIGHDYHSDTSDTSLHSEDMIVEPYIQRWGNWSSLFLNVDTCWEMWVDHELRGIVGDITRDLCRCTFSEFLQKWKFDYQICHRNTTNK